MPLRAAAYIDGFNLYHAICDQKANYLKWLNLRKLCEAFAPFPDYDLTHVFYFSAYATWRPDPYRRHREYVKALESAQVTVLLGKFKEKDRRCFDCGKAWKDHEEKETDVNIALHLLDGAYRNLYDRALLISADSDLAPAIQLVKARFPDKTIRLLTPVGRYHSLELMNAVGGKTQVRRITTKQLTRCLFPGEIRAEDGSPVATRPPEYDPRLLS
jgi:uncharacterized LabA/DUF88 family protein